MAGGEGRGGGCVWRGSEERESPFSMAPSLRWCVRAGGGVQVAGIVRQVRRAAGKSVVEAGSEGVQEGGGGGLDSEAARSPVIAEQKSAW